MKVPPKIGEIAATPQPGTPEGQRSNSIAADRLISLVERIERLTEEKRALSADIKDIFTEAKGTGFDAKALRTIIKLRALSATERDEQDMLLDTYRRALNI